MKRRALRRPDRAHSLIKEHDQEPRPFVRRADPDEIIAAGRFEILGVSKP
jgi:hypothetical protein